MFGGLSIKGESSKEDAPPPPPAEDPAPAGSSGFAFLQSSIGGGG
eukprot:CAMPEP_0183732624 /NCGR_PEP_ID=MMETSP0737-20130205/38957_1 /TAXON_ID=385413 /ORGANISM="Thalassiosira miniscula, Strain CCMP1093" /LENGTH=44 /DNA_ID= /DNA_START= /DNA_END= /DNA_ORIENTATION=